VQTLPFIEHAVENCPSCQWTKETRAVVTHSHQALKNAGIGYKQVTAFTVVQKQQGCEATIKMLGRRQSIAYM